MLTPKVFSIEDGVGFRIKDVIAVEVGTGTTLRSGHEG
jgi:hypothetical protein